MIAVRRFTVTLVMVIATALGGASIARAADVKTAGKLVAPKNAGLVAVCTDPVVQNVLSEDLRAARYGNRGEPAREVTITVTVNERLMKPGVSLGDVAPGDPAVVNLLKAAGAEPPLGDTPSEPIDPYSEAARRQATMPDDPLQNQFRSYQAMKNAMTGRGARTPYDDMADQIYDTVIIARASIGGAAGEFKVVAVVHPGDDVRKAKKLVAEEIANAVLH